MEIKTPEQKLQTEDLDNQEIFATGLWNKDQYSENDLDDMVGAFAKVGFKPPIKLGHSDTQKLLKGEGLPAAGWVENLRRAGDKLICDFKRVPRKIAELIKAGAWRKKSAEVYWDYLDEANSTKFPRVLKAVSLLGEDIPAITNLSDILTLYKKLPSGPSHAYEEEGREFRVYCMPETAMPMQNPLDSYLLQFPRKSKETVNYVDADEDAEERCGNCKFFIAYRSACTLVEGWIEQKYVCDYFESRLGLTMMAKKKDEIHEYTIEKRGEEWCLIAGSGKVLGCHPSEAAAQAQERAVQTNKHSQEEEDDMTFKTHMTREEISNICAPCGESMREKGISALTFSDEQVARFAGMDMKACMADATKVKDYPDENERKTACQKEMDKAMMESIQEIKGGPTMDEKKFEQEKAQLKADKEKAEKQAKEYQDRLAALEASNEEAKQKESEALAKVKKLERKGYDTDNESWIAAQKRGGRLTPVEEPRVRAIFAALYEDQRVVTFSQSDKEKKESLSDSIKSFITSRPSIFKEMSHADDEQSDTASDPQGEVDRQTQEHMEKQGMKIERYSEAMKAVLAKKGNEDLREKWLRIQQ